MNTKAVRYVAHMDILGMSTITSNNHEEAWQMLSELAVSREEALDTSLTYTGFKNPIHTPELIEAITFSDTVVLYSQGESQEELLALLVATLKIFACALHRCVPIRIGISHGIFYADPALSMYAGPALVRAYELGYKSQWLGIVLDGPVAEAARPLPLTVSPSELIVDWDVPYKQSSVPSKVLNWPVSLHPNMTKKPPISAEEFYSIFEPTFGPFINLAPVDRLKYENTALFLNQMYAAHVQV